MFKWIGTIQENIEAILGLIASIVTAWAVLRKMKKKADEAHNEFKALFALPAKFEEMTKELKTNGGSSLRDAINRIEHKQYLADERNKVLIFHSDNACFETDADGLYICVNEAFNKMLNRQDVDCLGNNWKQSIHPEDAECVIEAWLSAINDKRTFDYKFRFITSDDKTVYVYCRACAMKNPLNKIVGWFGIVKKISDIPAEWKV